MHRQLISFFIDLAGTERLLKVHLENKNFAILNITNTFNVFIIKLVSYLKLTMLVNAEQMHKYLSRFVWKYFNKSELWEIERCAYTILVYYFVWFFNVVYIHTCWDKLTVKKSEPETVLNALKMKQVLFYDFPLSIQKNRINFDLYNFAYDYDFFIA